MPGNLPDGSCFAGLDALSEFPPVKFLREQTGRARLFFRDRILAIGGLQRSDASGFRIETRLASAKGDEL